LVSKGYSLASRTFRRFTTMLTRRFYSRIDFTSVLLKAQRTLATLDTRGTEAPFLSELTVGDSPEQWGRAGFSIDSHSIIKFRNLAIRLVGPKPRGVTSWSFTPTVSFPTICNIPISALSVPAQIHREPIIHANRIMSIDHVVLKHGDLVFVENQFKSIGLLPKRQIANESKGLWYTFYRTDSTIIEVICPMQKTLDCGLIWGITFVSEDIDATHDYLKPLTKVPWNAVQPGRRITTLNTDHLDISLKIAFISPHGKPKWY
jgi:hypothetical protein